MKNEIYDNMLSAYGATTEQERRNAIFEVNQQVILAGLYNGGFFDVAAFYGGTCLRIFHGLQRFSEDMDFSLLAPDYKFDFTKYFQPIIDEFAIVGREVEIKKKDKKSFGKVESAFLKDNTDVYDVSFQTDKSIKIKIEVDTQPPLNFRTEQKLLLQPHSYDFEWYVRHNVPLDFAHLAERVRQFNNEEIEREVFIAQLKDRLASANINQVKNDVLPFVRNPKELDIWSNDYFVQLADMVKFE